MSEQPQRIGEQLADEIENPGETLSDFEQELDTLVEQRQAGMRRNRRTTSREDSPGEAPEHLVATDDSDSDDASPDESEPVVPAQEGSEGDENEPSAPAPAQEPPASPFTYTYNDQQFDEQAIKDGLELRAWRDTLSPQAMQAINAMLEGTHVLVERSEYERIQRGEGNASPVNKASGDATQSVNLPALSDDDLSDLPPAVADTIRAQRTALEQIQKQQQESEQRRLADAQTQYQRALSTAITNGRKTIMERYNLTEEEYNNVDRAAVASAQALIQAKGPEEGVLEALDGAYKRVYFERELARHIAAQQSAAQQVTEQKQKVTTRKANASSLGKGSSASGPSPTGTKADRRASLVNDVEALLNANN